MTLPSRDPSTRSTSSGSTGPTGPIGPKRDRAASTFSGWRSERLASALNAVSHSLQGASPGSVERSASRGNA